MWHDAIQRAKHWQAILGRSVWRFVSAFFAVAGALAFIRDEFLSRQWQERLKMPHWLPAWPWYWWAIGALVCIIIAVLEGSYREYRELSRTQGRSAKAGREASDAPSRFWGETKIVEQREVSVFLINNRRVTGTRNRHGVWLDAPVPLWWSVSLNERDRQMLDVWTDIDEAEPGSECFIKYIPKQGKPVEMSVNLDKNGKMEFQMKESVGAFELFLLGWRPPKRK